MPGAPLSPTERTLAQEYRDEFTGITGTSLTLTHLPAQTVDGVGLELLFKNGELLDGGGTMRESVQSASFTLAREPVPSTLLLFDNGILIDPTYGTTISASHHESFTGTTSTTITLGATPVGLVQVYKNGTPINTPADYTISGNVITLASAPVTSDVFDVYYTSNETITYAVSGKNVTVSGGGVSDTITVFYQCNGLDALGYSIDGATVTLATALTASDRVVALYPYRST